eukprot:COSAG05_NODE_6185_length_1005_cov_0.995585_1_plen_195_part_10
MVPVLLLALLLISHAQSERTVGIRGVPPARWARFFTVGREFLCDHGRTLRSTQVNDNYCDCDDGSDEPGTSACAHVAAAHAGFYCPNTGFQSAVVFRSRVNDGVCDCCDGSDEYDGSAKCANTCASGGGTDAATMPVVDPEKLRQGAQSRLEYMNRLRQSVSEEPPDAQQEIMQRFGKDGAYYGLQGSCFDVKSG